MSVSETLGWLLFGNPCRDFKEVNDRLNSALEKQREMKLKQREQDGFADTVAHGHSVRMDRLEAENKDLKSRIEVLEVKQEELKGRMLGWQEGFGDEVRRQLKCLDERIAKHLQSDDSGQFEISQWIEELKAVRKGLSALEKRMEGLERIKPIFIREADRQSDRTPVIPFHVPPYQPIRIWPDSNPDPFKFTCQMKEEVSD